MIQLISNVIVVSCLGGAFTAVALATLHSLIALRAAAVAPPVEKAKACRYCGAVLSDVVCKNCGAFDQA